MKNRKVDKIPVDKTKKYLWAYLGEKLFSNQKKTFWQIFTPLRLSLAGGVAVLLITALVLNQNFSFFGNIVNTPNTAYASFEMSAESEDTAGVSGNSSFVLKSSDDLSVSTIRDNLKVSPEIPFSVEKSSEKEFLIKPASALDSGKIYNFQIASALDNFSFSYQVKQDFKITSTIPADMRTAVPLNSGIELKFNIENFDEATAKNFFEISPETSGNFEKHGNTLTFVPKGGLKASTIYTVTLKQGLKVKGSDLKLSNDFVFSFETKPAKEQIKNYLNFSQDFSEVRSDIDLALSAYGNFEDADLSKIEVFKFNDSNEFFKAFKAINDIPSWSYNYKDSFRQETSKLESVGQFDTKLDKINYREYLYVPGLQLKKGFYLVEAKDDVRSQVLVQVSDLAVYTNVTLTDTVVWTADLATSQLITNAKVEILPSGREEKTNESGIAKFTTPDNWKLDFDKKTPQYLHISSGNNDELFVLVNSYTNEYNAYEYDISTGLDRTNYLPNDVVNFWGFIQKKNGDSVDKLKMKITYNYGDINDSFEITVSNGIFKGQYPLKNAAIGSYSVEISEGEKIVHLDYFEVTNYIKPAYEIKVETPKQNYFAGEMIDYTILAQYFDGSPVSYGALEYNDTNTGDEHIPLKLDADGKTQLQFKANKTYSEGDKYYSIRNQQYFQVYSPTAEETNITGESVINVFDSNVYLEPKSESNNNIATVSVKASNVDLEKMEKSENVYDYFGFIGEGASNQKIDGNIVKVHYEKIKSGEHYDFINKKTVEDFTYNRIEEPFENFNMQTDNSGNASYSFKSEKDFYYEISFTTLDKNGIVSKAYSTVYGEYFNPTYDYYTIKFLNGMDADYEKSFVLGEKISAVVSNGDTALPDSVRGKFLFMESKNGLTNTQILSSPKYETIFNKESMPRFIVSAVWFNGSDFIPVYGISATYLKSEKALKIEVKSDKEYYKPGEEVTLDIKVNDKDGNGTFADLNINVVDEAYYKIAYDNTSNPLNDIYNNISDGSLFTYVSHKSPINIMYSAEGKGGCFVGETEILMANGTSKKIQDIQAGDEILTRANPYSNKMESGKVLKTIKHIVSEYYVINDNLKVTGEHIVFVNGQFKTVSEIKIGDEMSGKDGNAIKVLSIVKENKEVAVYNFEVETFHTYFANGYYVHNDKGGGSARSDFKDTALFTSVKTDSFGNGSVKFKMPDNITSWRVTLKAVNPDNLTAGLGVSKIIVTKPLFVDLILNKQYSIKDSPLIKFRAFGKDLKEGDKIDFEIGEKDPVKISGVAFEGAYFELPKLKEGNNDITVSAKNGSNFDAIKKSFEVVGTRLKKTFINTQPQIKIGDKIQKSTVGATKITFLDTLNSVYYSELLNLYHTDGDRIDQVIAKKMAAGLLNKYFSEQFFINENVDSMKYQVETDGGLSLLQYSSSDIELSALFTLLSANPEESFNKPTLSAYFMTFLNNENSNLDEIVYALSGLAGLNEPVLLNIRTISVEETLTPQQKLLIGISMARLGSKNEAKSIFDNMKSVSALKDNERALYAILAAYCGDTEAMNIWRSVDTKGIKDDILNIYRLGLVNFGLENSKAGNASVVVSLNGKKESFKFTKPYSTFNVYAEPDSDLSVLDVSGDVSAVSVYTKNIEPENFVNDKDLVVSRKYFVNDKETNSFKEGDLVKVKLSLKLNRDFSKNGFVVTDILPSGLYPLTQNLFGVRYLPYNFKQDFIWPFNSNGQEIKFYMGYFDEDKNNIDDVYYYARVVSPGKFYAEPVKAESWADPSIASISKPDTVEISKQ